MAGKNQRMAGPGQGQRDRRARSPQDKTATKGKETGRDRVPMKKPRRQSKKQGGQTASASARATSGQADLIDLSRVVYAGMAVRLDQCPRDGLPEIVLAGRSNVGKSSLINGLCRRRSIARVSQTPGKTQAVQYFKIGEDFYLTDLPGYGFAKTSKENLKRFSGLVDNYLNSDRPIKGILHLVDIRHEPSALDVQMNDWMNRIGIPYALVLTKADKLSKAARQRNKDMILRSLSLPEGMDAVIISNLQKTGYEELAEEILRLLRVGSGWEDGEIDLQDEQN